MIQEKPFIEENIGMVQDTKFSNDEVNILILKSIKEKEEEG